MTVYRLEGTQSLACETEVAVDVNLHSERTLVSLWALVCWGQSQTCRLRTETWLLGTQDRKAVAMHKIDEVI